LKNTLVVALERLGEEPYASVICYPKPSKAELRRRVKEMQRLGVKTLEFSGGKQAFNIPVLGKGCIGIVAIAQMNGDKTAIKIRRVDADRLRMQQEAKMLQKANSVQVGPRLLDVTKNFLLMQFIDGDLLPAWLEKLRKKAETRRVLRDILEQSWRLDEAGLDHGELSHAPKHIIIDRKGKPFIVDFETASLSRRPSNVTSICQFLFISGSVAKIVAEKVGEKDEKAFIGALRLYKSDRNRKNFERILKVCNL